MTSSSNILFIAIIFIVLVVVIQAGFSIKKGLISGLILPFVFLLIFLYNLIKPMLIPNPYSTMEEGMLMTLGIIGFTITIITLVIVKFFSRKL